jgi:hypothetical protein
MSTLVLGPNDKANYPVVSGALAGTCLRLERVIYGQTRYAVRVGLSPNPEENDVFLAVDVHSPGGRRWGQLFRDDTSKPLSWAEAQSTVDVGLSFLPVDPTESGLPEPMRIELENWVNENESQLLEWLFLRKLEPIPSNPGTGGW